MVKTVVAAATAAVIVAVAAAVVAATAAIVVVIVVVAVVAAAAFLEVKRPNSPTKRFSIPRRRSQCCSQLFCPALAETVCA